MHTQLKPSNMQCCNLLEGLEALAIVLLYHRPELVDAPLIDQVLQPGLLPVIPSPIVTLCCHDGLDGMEDVLLGNIPNGVCQASKGVLIPVSSAHASANHKVKTLKLAAGTCDDHHANVICEEVHAVVAWDCDGDFELSGQEEVAVDGLWGILKVGTIAIEGSVGCHLRVLQSTHKPFDQEVNYHLPCTSQ